jgi:MFS superfamily sulfate permease-like transporter
MAGLTLAANAVPVSVADASLARLPPQTSLYCYLVGGVRTRSFRNLTTASGWPTSAIPILIGSALGTLATADPMRQTQLAAAVAVLAGLSA